MKKRYFRHFFYSVIGLDIIASTYQTYLILQLKLSGISVITTILLLVNLCIISIVIINILSCSFQKIKENSINIKLSLTTTFILLLIIELFLRYGLSVHTTYMERQGVFHYVSMFQKQHTSWFHTFQPSSKLVYSTPEYQYEAKINSEGLREVEIPIQKKESEFRIITLGDSFTEGAGVDYESSWPRVLEKRLSTKYSDKKITVINSGVSGSDPFFEYMLLSHRLLKYQPDLVVIAINSSDIFDISIKGGMERFLPDGEVEYRKKSPWWEYVYAASFISRHIIHDLYGVDHEFKKPGEKEIEQAYSLEQIYGSLFEFNTLSVENNFKLLVIFHPHLHEISRTEFIFNDIISRLKTETDIHVLNMVEYFSRYVDKNKIDMKDYYWPIDYHHNKKGYKLFAESVYDHIKEIDLINF